MNYNKVLEFDPGDTTAINDRAEAYFYMDDYDKAIQDYEKLHILLPQQSSPYYNCGVCYRRKGDLGKAIENFDKTIELGNREAHVYKSRGLAYMDMGEYDKAIADFKMVEELGDDFGSMYARAAEKKAMECSFEQNKRPDGNEDKILDINKIHAMEGELLEEYDAESFHAFHKFLCGKFGDFVTDKEILDSFVRSSAEQLEPVAKYALLMFGGLIVSCFELPVFKNRPHEGNREDEMTQYIKDFLEKSKFLISALELALAFDDDDVKKRYADFIRQNNLLPEVEPVHEDIYGVLAHYPTRQPVLRDYIAEQVFTSPLECTTKSKIFLFTFLYLIIDFLNEYYFE
jgi:tetratricopeptide (TPR) repeat protein